MRSPPRDATAHAGIRGRITQLYIRLCSCGPQGRVRRRTARPVRPPSRRVPRGACDSFRQFETPQATLTFKRTYTQHYVNPRHLRLLRFDSNTVLHTPEEYHDTLRAKNVTTYTGRPTGP